MAEPQVAPYGSWKSPVTADMIVGETTGLGRIVLDGEDTYWAENRPWEDGRAVIVKRTKNGETFDVTPEMYSVGTRIHEYGTRGYTVVDGVVYFSNFEDQRMYRQREGKEPVPLTPEASMRYGSKAVDRKRGRIICVREDHSTDTTQPVNEIVAVVMDGSCQVDVLVTSNDFYSSPCLSPDGSALAWLTWNHPNMPWDGTELWVASVEDDGLLGSPILVAGGVDECVIQPEWSPDGTLYFVSDRTGWANLHRWVGAEDVEIVVERQAEFAKTHWWGGIGSYGFESADRLICSYVERGIWSVGRVYADEHRLEPIVTPYPEMGRGDFQVAEGRAVFAAGSPTKPMSILELDLATNSLTLLRKSNEIELDPDDLSIPEAIEFPTDNEETAYAFYYPPKNKHFLAPEGEKPPLLVTCHGGPHDAATIDLDLDFQFWTSRGIGVLDVNYGGSTGYGRDYRERLIGEWGVVDVDDCVNAALYMVESRGIDPDRMAISGGSAGGYTALAAMTFRDVFSAGASHFGVSDLEALLNDIHKFDAYSLVGLVGPYPLYRKRYVERSPINYAEYLACPVIFFQGLEDTIVPADQSEAMFNVLKERGVPTAYVTFEGEYHGFRQSESIKRAMEAELYFYSKVFGFELADPVPPVPIENLEALDTRTEPTN